MVFSTNQARHFFVANAVPAGALTNAGDLAVKQDADGNLYFQYLNALKEPIRSDLITNITYAKATSAASMATPLKKATVTLTKVEAGADYVVKILVKQFAGMSDEETYTIYGSARAANTTTSTVATAIANNLNKTMNKMISNLFTVTVSGSAITIQEVAQPWTLGTMEQVPVYFEVSLVPVDENVTPSTNGATTTYDWGTVTIANNGSVGNGNKIADLEYFCMGERGDQYRNIGWPNVIKTNYLVDPTKTYDVLDIHYSYIGSNESVQKSEKDITIVATSASKLVDTVIGKINTALGTEIAIINNAG